MAAVSADQSVTEVRIVTNTRFAGKSKEEAAAIRIQTAFRGYLVCVVLYSISYNYVELFGSLEDQVEKVLSCFFHGLIFIF